MQWRGGGITKYDPTLTRVTYAAGVDKDYLGKAGPGYFLWDLVNQKEWVGVANSEYGDTPVWSLDGSKLLGKSLLGDLLVITRDGEVAQVTHLKEDLESSSTKANYSVESYSWSYDGQNIAFWLVNFEDKTNLSVTLAILNLGTGEITDTCISAGKLKNSDYLRLLEPPIWSPDGKYLAIVANHQQEWGKNDTLLVDLAEGFAAKIGESLTPVGWLNNTKK